jgi:hypothetical protein
MIVEILLKFLIKITIQDTIAPVITTLRSTTLSCNPEFAVATATDNCDADVKLTSFDVTICGLCLLFSYQNSDGY